MKKFKKIIAVCLVVALLSGGGIFGWRHYRQKNAAVVKVYPFSMVGMTEYWGDTRDSYGPVTTDRIQTVYLSDTQTVEEILVEEGQQVTKGDLLMTFDTSLSQLELERKELELQKAQLDLEDANKELQTITWMVPMGTPPTEPETEPTEPDYGYQLTADYALFRDAIHTGETQDAAFICWVPAGQSITTEFLQEVIGQLVERPEPTEPTDPTDATDATEPTDVTDPTDATEPTDTTDPTDVTEPTDTTDPTDVTEPTDSTEPQPTQPTVTPEPTEATQEPTGEPTAAPRENIATAKEQLILLTAPGADGTFVAQLDVGMEVEVTRLEAIDSQIWAYVKYDALDVQGWVVSDKLDMTNVDLPIGDSFASNETEPTDVSTEPTDASEEPTTEPTTEPATEPTSESTEIQPTSTEAPVTEPAETAAPATEPPSTEPPATELPVTEAQSTEAPAAEPTAVQEATGEGSLGDLTGEESLILFSAIEVDEFTPTQEPTEPTEPQPDIPEKECYPYYVIFKVTEGNWLKGERRVWIGLHVFPDGSFAFFDASNMDDYSIPQEPVEEVTEPEVDYMGSGYTYTQIQAMKEDQQKKIKDLEIQLKLLEAELKIMEKELSDGHVYAEQDGKVISLLTEEDAKFNSQPIMKISSGGGYYIEASISELERNSVKVGDEVTVDDWSYGASYPGVIVSIGDVPSSSNTYNGNNNPNASSYPMRVFVDEQADLQAGNYAGVSYSTGEQTGVYLENAFLRTQDGVSFVYVMGADGKLEQRNVTVGKSLNGYYVEIVEGLSEEDMIAFPYGKNVKPGAPAEEGDYSDMYA